MMACLFGHRWGYYTAGESDEPFDRRRVCLRPQCHRVQEWAPVWYSFGGWVDREPVK